MNICIKFYKEADVCGVSEVIECSTIEKMKHALTKAFNDAKCEEVRYLWLENGMCGIDIEFDYNTKRESDMTKMADMIADRVEKFGRCEIEGDFGDYKRIGISDYDNEYYDLKALER